MQLSESLSAGDERAFVHHATLRVAGNDGDRHGRPPRAHAGVSEFGLLHREHLINRPGKSSA